MAYETGSATDPADLLDKLRLFCIAESIVVNEFLNDGTYDILSVQIGTGFFSLGYDSANEEIVGYQATGFTTSTAWGAQPNATQSSNAQGSTTNLVPDSTISIYHFFYFPGGMLHVAFLNSDGLWRTFGLGELVKYGTYTGGAFMYNNYRSTNTSQIDQPYSSSHSNGPMGTAASGREPVLRVDHPSANYFYYIGENDTLATRGYSNQQVTGSQGEILLSTPSSSSQATSTDVISYSIVSDANTDKTIPVGELPDCRIINLFNYNAGDTYDTDWLVFPLVRRDDPDLREDLHNSGYVGLAFRFQ